MSGTETERKFLIRKDADFKALAVSCSHIRQGYIPCETATVRIRTRDSQAYLTIKSHSDAAGLSRYEFETQISLDEAEHLLLLCRGGMIDKHRYLVPSGRHTFEVDEFHGDNEGLLMAEVELESGDEAFVKPPFVGMEVTGDRRFYNSRLLTSPYSLWRDSVPEEYR